MNTVYCLAIFLTVVGFGMFLLQLTVLTLKGKGYFVDTKRERLEMLYIQQNGVAYYANYWWLALGVVGAICVATIKV